MTKTRKGDFLDAIEKRLQRIEREASAVDKPAKKRRVTFNNEVYARGFLKSAPPRDVQSPVLDESSQLASPHSAGSETEESYEDEMSDELDEDGFGSDGSETGSDDEDDLDASDNELDFEGMSPEEQMRYLSEPVSDDDEDSEASDHDDEHDGASDSDDYSDSGDFEEDGTDSGDSASGDDKKTNAKSKKSFLDEFDVDSDEEVQDARSASSFAQQQERLRKTISELESQSVAEKAWQYRGEVPATMRPINSLLEQDVDFTQISRAAPPSTVELSDLLEKTIRQRILDRAWDDPVRRTAAEVAALSRPAAAPRVDAVPEAQDGPRKSLADVYADEAAARLRPATETGPRPTVDAKTRAAHDEITALFTKICRKIDALSRFKFAPHYEPLAELSVASDARFTKRQV